MKELVLTQSTVKSFTRCPRQWWLGHYRGLARADSYRSPLVVGNLVHDALAAYYEGKVPDPIAWVKEQSLEMLEERPEWAEEIMRDAELAGIMVEGYVEWLTETGADYELEVVEPERVIRVVLRPGDDQRVQIVLQGKLDGKVAKRVVEDHRWTAFLEHKTVGNFVDLPAVAQLDRQLLTYHLLEFIEFLEQHPDTPPVEVLTDGAILNMLRKVKRTSRAKPPFYLRHDVRHNIHELRNHWRHTIGVAEDIQRKIDLLDAGGDHHRLVPPVPQTDCRYSCEFFTVCPLLDDGSDVESVLELEYAQHDPLGRYTKEVVP